MSRPLKIFLVRHGESLGNVDKKVHHKLSDHAIGLSDNGFKQALEAGRALTNYLNNDKAIGSTRLWVSPYMRTRQTAEQLQTVYQFWSGERMDRRESINLVEQQFGLFDGLEDAELAEKYPAEHAHYNKCEKFEGKFWARLPLGESRFDVAMRVHQFFGTIIRDYDKHGIDKVVIVSHGVTIRSFVMQWLHLPFEWFEKEPNPTNCSIRLIEDNSDKGYIYKR